MPAFLVVQGSALFHFEVRKTWVPSLGLVSPPTLTPPTRPQGPHTARLRRAWLLHDCHVVPVAEPAVACAHPHALDLRHRTAPPTRLLLRTAAARDEWASALLEAQSVTASFPVGAAVSEDVVARRIAFAEEAMAEMMRAQAQAALAAAAAERRHALDVVMGDYVEEAQERERSEQQGAAAAAQAEELARQLAQARAKADALQAQMQQAGRRETQECGTQCDAEDEGLPSEQTPSPDDGQDLPTPLSAPVKPPPPSPPRMTPSAAQRAVWPAATRRELSFP